MSNGGTDRSFTIGCDARPNALCGENCNVAADPCGGACAPGETCCDNNAGAGLPPICVDAQNDPNAVFVIQSDAAMNTTAGVAMNLINGAKASNIYWVTTGAGAMLAPAIVALTGPRGALAVVGAALPILVLTRWAALTRLVPAPPPAPAPAPRVSAAPRQRVLEPV